MECRIDDIIKTSNQNIKKAHEIIHELKIEGIWKKHSGNANLIGSVKTNLLMNHLDIDYHVYTENFTIEESFAAIGEIAQAPGIKDAHYINMLEYEDRCLEWHLTYQDDEAQSWQIDIIHIMNGSKYAGKFERVAAKINNVMTKERRERILRIKYEASEINEKVIGIEVCRAVIADNICNYEEFKNWKQSNTVDAIDEWEPIVSINP